MSEEEFNTWFKSIIDWLEDNTDWWDPLGDRTKDLKNLLKEKFCNV